MTIEVKVIADSINSGGERITTMQLKYPRFIHAEFMTHRSFCIAGGAVLEFDLPSGGRGSRFRVHRMTIEDFANKWFEGASKGKSARHNGLFLSDLDDSLEYSAEDIRALLGMANRLNLNNLCRRGQINGAKKIDGFWVAPGESWKLWRLSTGYRRFSLRSRLSLMNLRQVNEATGVIQHTAVTDCVISGHKEVFRVSSGQVSVVASADHMIFTNNGWKPVKDLLPGVDSVCVYSYGTGINPDKYKKIGGRWVSQWARQIRQEVFIKQGGLCALSGVELGTDFHIHHVIPKHIDPSRAFDINNVIAITPEEHIKAHKKQGWQEGVPLGSKFTVIDQVVSEGVQMTYDLSVSGPFHNFFADGIVVHNSRNASSSRAIPVSKMLRAVWHEPAAPVYWGSNKPGMQAGAELRPFRRLAAKVLWKASGRAMCGVVWVMSKMGLHKQVSNRLLEPWQHIHVVVTSTEWQNFFDLRCHPDAQPEFQELAKQMRLMRNISSPVKLDDYDWHLPYIDVLERERLSTMEAIQVSAARCCRVSYLNHEGRTSTLEQDVARYESLVNAVPPHMSPVEHQAMALPGLAYANFRGWASHRWLLEEAAIHKVWDSSQTS